MNKLVFSILIIAVVVALAPASAQLIPRNDLELRASYAPSVRKASPAVVNIYTKGVVRTRARSAFRDPFFDEFFNRGFGGMTRERVQSSLGSGVIVQPDGVIVTNNHVIEGMSEIKVVLTDRREFEAELLLADPQTDLAILKIDADEDLPFLTFTDSDAAEVGDIVLAIGNPFGVGQTVTSGIVSALARTQVNVSDFQFFIQTDAAINPGNSGGALVDVDGNLLGVNTAIYSRSGGSNGIGFAIPGNLVRQVVNSAVNGGQMIRRPWIGASSETVTSNLALALDLSRPGGALLNEVYPGGPADRAGLREGDVITMIDDKDIFDSESLRYRVATRPENETVLVRAVRNGRERDYRVSLSLPPEIPARNETVIGGQNPFAGLKVANLSPALNFELGRTYTDEGVIIVDTSQSRFASRFGFRNSYKILSVNGVEINSVDDLVSVAGQGGRSWTIRTQNTRGQISTLQYRG